MNKLYCISLVTPDGVNHLVRYTDSAESALELAASYYNNMIDRFSDKIYRLAEYVLITKRNAQGDYDGLACFPRH